MGLDPSLLHYAMQMFMRALGAAAPPNKSKRCASVVGACPTQVRRLQGDDGLIRPALLESCAALLLIRCQKGEGGTRNGQCRF